MIAALVKGQLGRIEEINGPARVTRRLAEMGVTPGVTVEMLRPGGPCILRVNRTRLSMSRDLQAHVRVTAPTAMAAKPAPTKA